MKLRSTAYLISISMVRSCGTCLMLKIIVWKQHGISRKDFMLGIPRNTHLLFIEPRTEIQHIIKFSSLKRFVNFVNGIETSTKPGLRNMLEIVKHYYRPLHTGSNLRKLMLLLKKGNVDEISEVNLKSQIYLSIPSGHQWEVFLAKEIIQIKNNDLETE